MKNQIIFRALYKGDVKRGTPLMFYQKVVNDELMFVMEGDENFQYPYAVVMGDDDWIKMQYVGLKDKNNKKIFEGDILEYVCYLSGGVPFGKGENIVKYKAPKFELVNYEDVRWGGYDNLKIVTNIYENKRENSRL